MVLVDSNDSFFTIAVPPPVVSILPSTTSVYAGSFITINCSIQLTTAVDSQVTVSVVWKKNGMMLRGSTNRMLLDAILISNSSLYLAQIVFSPMQLSTDDGVYACEVTVNTELDEFVINTGSSSSNISLQAAGMINR